MSQTKAQLVVGLNVNASAPASALQIDASGNINLDSNTLYVDAANNRVGVGTSSPNAILDLTATAGAGGQTSVIRFGLGATAESWIGVANGAGNIIANSAQGDTVIRNDGGKILLSTDSGTTAHAVIDSSGRLGIGSSSPDVLITAKQTNAGATGATLRLVNASTTVNSATKLAFTNTTSETADSSAITAVRTASGQYMAFGIEGTEAVRIDESRRVGIGTASAGATLHVNDSGGGQDGTIRFGGSTYYGQIKHDAGATGYNIYNSQDTGGHIFQRNGNEQMRLDASSRLLLGTSSARSNLYIGGTAITPPVQIETSGSTYSSGLSLLTYSASNYAPVLTIGTSNSNTPGTNAAVGNNFDLGYINFVGNDGTNFRAGAYIYAQTDGGVSTGDLPTRLVFSTTADGASSPTERMRINSNGAFLLTSNAVTIAPSSGTGDFYVQGANAAGANARIFLTCPGSNEGSIWYERSTSRLYIYSQSGGVYLGSTATSWTANSDERLKDIIEPIENAANKVSSLRAVIGKYKTDEEGTRRSFLIAQDVQAVLPEAVDASNPDSLGVSYTDVIPLLVAAIKEQQAMIADLQGKVAALESA